MRHVLGFLLGVIAAAVVGAGAAWGADRFVVTLANGEKADSKALAGLAALVAVGLLVGILCSARWISPVAPLIAGLGLIGGSAYWANDPKAFADLLPDNSLRAPIINVTGIGIYALAGGALFASALAGSRWRNRNADRYGPAMSEQLPPWDSPTTTGSRTAVGAGTAGAASSTAGGVDWSAPSARAGYESDQTSAAGTGYPSGYGPTSYGDYSGSSTGSYAQQSGYGSAATGYNTGGTTSSDPQESTQLFRPASEQTGSHRRNDPYGR